MVKWLAGEVQIVCPTTLRSPMPPRSYVVSIKCWKCSRYWSLARIIVIMFDAGWFNLLRRQYKKLSLHIFVAANHQQNSGCSRRCIDLLLSLSLARQLPSTIRIFAHQVGHRDYGILIKLQTGAHALHTRARKLWAADVFSPIIMTLCSGWKNFKGISQMSPRQEDVEYQ